MFRFLVFSLPALLLVASFADGSIVEYDVVNNCEAMPGGDRFNREIGVAYSEKVMENTTHFIWKLFQENTYAERKSYDKVILFIDCKIPGESYVSGNEVHLDSFYIQGIQGTNPILEFTGRLFHELTHVWQWTGKRSAPGGLLEGMADFVRLKAGFAPEVWMGNPKGSRWDQGYDVTARFLDYCDGIKSGFVAGLNKEMKDTYSDSYFVELLDKTVDQVWDEYTSN
ncbi:hypothetical protein LIER_01685 [Lithospermum erythrorhizon]|uniref:Plant basic secretory protein (BSP) family protein n=1 Tax=Lithospermum erythrorhizon TaxID=34254 RepID=A0AAV3NM93_LITER